jgi:hypothetical protein
VSGNVVQTNEVTAGAKYTFTMPAKTVHVTVKLEDAAALAPLATVNNVTIEYTVGQAITATDVIITLANVSIKEQ